MTILVTGGAGFIGSNFVLDWFAQGACPLTNLDKLTCAGNPANLRALKDNPEHVFVHGDICDRELVRRLLERHTPRALVHFAAESHVDRSIHGPAEFVQTNILGHSPCSRKRGFGWKSKSLHNARISDFCTSRPTRYSVRSDPTTRLSTNRLLSRPTAPTQPRRRPRTIWCARTITPMGFRR